MPVLTYHRAGLPGPCRPATVAEVSGSFSFLLDDALFHAPCPPQISLYWYWSDDHFLFPPGLEQHFPVNPAERKHDLDTAQIVVLEENEALVPNSGHAARMIEALLPQTAGAEH